MNIIVKSAQYYGVVLSPRASRSTSDIVVVVVVVLVVVLVLVVVVVGGTRLKNYKIQPNQ